MHYSNIKSALSNLDRTLRQRDEFIKRTAELLMTQLHDTYGFPNSEICLQAIEAELKDEKIYTLAELPTKYTDGRQGFRVRFKKMYEGYLSGFMSVTRWVFSVDGDDIVAQIVNENYSYKSPLYSEPSKQFISDLAEATIKYFVLSISKAGGDPSVQSSMGFHSIED